MAQNLNQKRTLLFAFMNGSYKKATVTEYDHKEWIVATKEDGSKMFINAANVKWIEELKVESKIPTISKPEYPATDTYKLGQEYIVL